MTSCYTSHVHWVEATALNEKLVLNASHRKGPTTITLLQRVEIQIIQFRRDSSDDTAQAIFQNVMAMVRW